MIGNRIGGRYEILRFIGGGGMSRVYLAHDIILDRDVAIKILNYDFSNEEELKRRFMREALSATSLTHPHIVDIYDVDEDGDLHYLVMEYIEGQTLKEYINSNGPLTPEQALPIMQQLVSAISNAHYNGIIHRDIKPQNILMDRDGNVKITDFGIAMALSATVHTRTNSVLGTVHYLSPEQARGGMATKKSDIYSLGIVFYELLTAQLPFSGESAVSIALKHLQEDIPSVRKLHPSIPQSVENVILKSTAKDAISRYKSADDVQEDLSTVLSPERANEDRFTLMYDDDATRAIPAVTDTSKFGSVEKTKAHAPVEVEETSEPPKKRKKWPIIAAVFGGLAIVILLLLFLPGLQKIEIPDVSGLDEAEAVDKLEDKGFIVEERTEQNSDEFETGQVIRTVPEAGEKRASKAVITLYVSIGKETTTLSDYTDRDYEQVKGVLDNYGFKSIEPKKVYSDEPAGIILEQDPKADTEIVLSETDLLFTVSKGKEVRVLENLVGYDEDKLSDYAKTSGFDIVIVSKEHSSTVQEGVVISQSPAADTKVVKGGKIEVVQSKGPAEKPVKYIVQTVTIDYVPEESEQEPDDEKGEDEKEKEPEKVPQTIRIYVEDRKNSMADLFEEFTITEETVKRITIELEEGQRGGYRIMRGSTLIEDESFNYDDAD